MHEGKVIDKELNVNELIKNIMKESSRKGCGAIVMFIGFVKGVVNDKEVYRLEYEAYEPYASKILNKLAEDLAHREGVDSVLIYHRTGSLKPGEPSIYILVSAKSRKDAFSTAMEAIERVKHEVPISKLEIRSDGEYWVIGDGRRIKRSSKSSD
mgnify:CR=1 FL=1